MSAAYLGERSRWPACRRAHAGLVALVLADQIRRQHPAVLRAADLRDPRHVCDRRADMAGAAVAVAAAEAASARFRCGTAGLNGAQAMRGMRSPAPSLPIV